MTMDECRANIDASVVYTAHHGAKEDGVIASTSLSYVFIRFGTGQGTKACRPEDLTLATP